MSAPDACVFCELINDRSKLVTPLVYEWSDAIVLVPLNPCTPSHLLVISKVHVKSAIHDSVVAGALMARAAWFARDNCHIIANNGELADQSVFHLHYHIIPRREGDGIQMPWSWQRGTVND